MNLEYPEETEGSKLAREIRKRCNSLTDEEQKKYYAAGMRIIYKGKKTGERCMNLQIKEKQIEAKLRRARELVARLETKLEFIRELIEEETGEKRVPVSVLRFPRAIGLEAALIEAIQVQPGRFTWHDVVATVKQNHPSLHFSLRSVERPIKKFVARGLIKIVMAQRGRAPMVYEAGNVSETGSG